MKARLTLKIDNAILVRTKEYSKQTGLSLSKIVAGFFEELFAKEAQKRRSPSRAEKNNKRDRNPKI